MTFKTALAEHLETFLGVERLEPAVEKAADLIVRCLKDGRKVMFCGNGGSAADSQHFAAELVGKFLRDREPLAAVALTTDTSAITCIGNDFGFGSVFSRQVRAIGNPGDCLVIISTSGDSRNVVCAADVARENGIRVVGLLGKDGGLAAYRCDIAIIVPSMKTASIQEAHTFIIHALCELIEQSF